MGESCTASSPRASPESGESRGPAFRSLVGAHTYERVDAEDKFHTAGRSPEGLPVGVQLIGPMFEDRTVLRLAELLEQEIGGFRPVFP